MGVADYRRAQLGLLPRDVVFIGAVVGRDGHIVGDHGGVCHVVPAPHDTPGVEGQRRAENFHQNGKYFLLKYSTTLK